MDNEYLLNFLKENQYEKWDFGADIFAEKS